MKLPDSEILTADDYLLITDPWRSEWEKGVQVPVNPDVLPEPTVRYVYYFIFKNVHVCFLNLVMRKKNL